jgi:hypothetical protein
MPACSYCGRSIDSSSRFCSSCGAPNNSAVAFQNASPAPANSDAIAAKGFGQLFGLDPRIAFLTFILDLMLNAGEFITMELALPVSLAAGIVLGFIAYRAQMKWYGDDSESAMIKATMLALLTAIPTALPSFLYGTAGLIGLAHVLRRK